MPKLPVYAIIVIVLGLAMIVALAAVFASGSKSRTWNWQRNIERRAPLWRRDEPTKTDTAENGDRDPDKAKPLRWPKWIDFRPVKKEQTE